MYGFRSNLQYLSSRADCTTMAMGAISRDAEAIRSSFIASSYSSDKFPVYSVFRTLLRGLVDTDTTKLLTDESTCRCGTLSYAIREGGPHLPCRLVFKGTLPISISGY